MKLDELSKPIDKQTTIVISPNVKNWFIPKKRIGSQFISKIPISTIRFKDHAKTGIDLTNKRIGRFTVIGFLGKKNKKKPGNWLVKCDCGLYTIKNSKTLRLQKDKESKMCLYCEHLEYLKEK